MRIDIDSLTEAELVDLNNHRAMMVGILTRYNKKTVTGHHRGRRALECRPRLPAAGGGIQRRSRRQSKSHSHAKEMKAKRE